MNENLFCSLFLGSIKWDIEKNKKSALLDELEKNIDWILIFMKNLRN